MSAPYRADLAWIHHTGFAEFAESSASGVLALLARAGISSGTVIEAGCGSGVLAKRLDDAGYRVLAFDPSPSMIELARLTAPAASFEVAALDEAILPSCSAVIAMGEVLNYAGLDAMSAFVEEAAAALLPGGLLLFDVAEGGAYPPHDERRIGGDDWSVIVIKDSDGRQLTRRILTFRQVDGAVRRDDEVHTLELYERAELLALLREHGFRATVRRSYGKRRLPSGHAVYVARRSGG